MSNIYYIVDNNNLYSGTIFASEIDSWIKKNTNPLFIDANLVTIQTYIAKYNIKSLETVAPPVSDPVIGAWTWNGTEWILNSDTKTFPMETIDSLRQAAYQSTTDHLKISADYNAIIANSATPAPNPPVLPDYSKWIAAKKAIMERYPKP